MRAYEIIPQHKQLVINESLLNEEGARAGIASWLFGLVSKGGPEAEAAIKAGEKVINNAKAAEQGASGIAQGVKDIGTGVGQAGKGVMQGAIGGAVGWTTLQINDLVNWVKTNVPKIGEMLENGTIPLALLVGGLVLYGGVKLIDKYTAPDAQPAPAAAR
jgi:hypothetical protein